MGRLIWAGPTLQIGHKRFIINAVLCNPMNVGTLYTEPHKSVCSSHLSSLIYHYFATENTTLKKREKGKCRKHNIFIEEKEQMPDYRCRGVFVNWLYRGLL